MDTAQGIDVERVGNALVLRLMVHETLADIGKMFSNQGGAVISVVTYAELRAGLEIQGAKRKQDELVLALLVSRIPVLPSTASDAESFWGNASGSSGAQP